MTSHVMSAPIRRDICADFARYLSYFVRAFASLSVSRVVGHPERMEVASSTFRQPQNSSNEQCTWNQLSLWWQSNERHKLIHTVVSNGLTTFLSLLVTSVGRFDCWTIDLVVFEFCHRCLKILQVAVLSSASVSVLPTDHFYDRNDAAVTSKYVTAAHENSHVREPPLLQPVALVVFSA